MDQVQWGPRSLQQHPDVHHEHVCTVTVCWARATPSLVRGAAQSDLCCSLFLRLTSYVLVPTHGILHCDDLRWLPLSLCLHTAPSSWSSFLAGIWSILLPRYEVRQRIQRQGMAPSLCRATLTVRRSQTHGTSLRLAGKFFCFRIVHKTESFEQFGSCVVFHAHLC